MFGCLGNPPGGRKEKRGEFIDIKPMSKIERLAWRWLGIVSFAILLFFSLFVVLLFLLGPI